MRTARINVKKTLQAAQNRLAHAVLNICNLVFLEFALLAFCEVIVLDFSSLILRGAAII